MKRISTGASMGTLFASEIDDPDTPGIPGLSYLREYITEHEEGELTAVIDSASWDTTWDRRRQLYGAGYGNSSSPQVPLPAWGLVLANRLHQDHLSDQLFNQMLVNEYQPGQGIALHRDYKPFDRTVVSVSLLSDVVMDFRHTQDERRFSLLLERRSALILSDEARYDWEHGIARRKNDRWQGLVIPRQRRLSVTFRFRKETSGRVTASEDSSDR
jgi:alkylated DNA repair dioxygenase AlkB